MSGPTPPSTPKRNQYPLPGAEPSGENRPDISVKEKPRLPPTPETPNTIWQSLQVSRPSSQATPPLSPALFGPYLIGSLSDDEPEGDADVLQDATSPNSSIGTKIRLSITNLFNVAARRSRRERDALSKARRVDGLIDLVRDIEKGVPQGGQEVITRKILPTDYRTFLERLETSDNDIFGYFHEVLRYEYRPSLTGKTQISIRMNSNFHESMSEDINLCVNEWLGDIRRNPRREYTDRASEIAEEIRSRGSPVVKVGEKDLRADSSYRYTPAGILEPGMVVEVAWSQLSGKLRRKAVEFIQETGGNVRTVVGLDFSGTYKIWEKMKDEWDRTSTPQRGPVVAYVWRAAFDRRTGQTILDEEGQLKITESVHTFCNEAGEVKLREHLSLRLKDIVPERVCRGENINMRRDLDGVELVISSQTLMKFYDRGLRDQKEMDDRTKPERGLRQAEKDAKQKTTGTRRNTNQEKDLEEGSSLRSFLHRHTHNLRVTAARRHGKGFFR